jgi:predicted outer membrane repeat protein
MTERVRWLQSVPHRLIAIVLSVGGLACFALVAQPPQLAGAAALSVTNCNDSGAGSLRDAVAGAASGDTVSFSLSCSTITLTSGAINIATNLTISGPGASALALSGNNASQVFVVGAGVPSFAISGVTIENGNGPGGGIYDAGGTDLTVGASDFINNFGSRGGAIYDVGTGSLSVAGTTFSGNQASVYGGAIYITGGGALTVSDSSFTNNQGSYDGGGILSEGPLTVTRSSFSGNTAETGGGIFIENTGGPRSVTDSTFAVNNAGDGGGIANSGSDSVLTVSDSTFSQNAATSFGGGLYNCNVGSGGGTDLTHVTLWGNSSGDGPAGGIYNGCGSTTLVATIVAGSLNIGRDCGGVITDGGYNLDDDVSCGFSGTSLALTPAGLDPSGLQDNGGPTQTIALEKGSAAIGAVGSQSLCSTDDQRGLGRPTPCDIGAYQTGLPTTGVLLPAKGAAVSGSTILGAAATNATSVVFLLFGGTYGLSGHQLCTATESPYGWYCSWNTSNVPDGNYTLVSVAFDGPAIAASAGVGIRVNNTMSLPTTSVLVPSGGTTLTGTTYLDASASNADTVGFALFGGSYGLSGHLLCIAGPTLYGYLCAWNTATVPNGSYVLVSVAINSAGGAFSSGVGVTVKN